MIAIRKILASYVLASGALFFAGLGSTASAQSVLTNPSPCGFESSVAPTSPDDGSVSNQDPSAQQSVLHGLLPVYQGMLVYDSNQNVCWLADANLAGHPDVRAAVPLSAVNPDGISTPVINPDGTMDYQTALNWVNALNNYNNGQGWLNHNNWQLPTNPATDLTCSAVNTDNFGIQCTGSALGNLYNVGLAVNYPDSVVHRFVSYVSPFINLQPGLYWTADPNNGGETTFSFNTGIRGGNTTQYNFFHVLPMTKTVLGPIPQGTGVLPYLSGPAAGKAVYDTITGISWTLDANLPAKQKFGVTGTITLTANQNGKTNGGTVTVPLIDQDGAVHFSAVDPANTTSGWIVSMNNSGYAGTNDWTLPGIVDLKTLYSHLSITAGDTRLEWPFRTNPFWGLQPGFYWACVPDSSGSGLCDYSQSAPASLEWSFNFDDGFEGTDLPNKQFYVMVYFPAP